MTLYDKIILLRPNLQGSDFFPITGTIAIENDGNGDYIKSWNHPTETQPTQEELDNV